MRALQIVIGLIAVGKGVYLLLDPDGFIRLARQFTGLFPAPARKVVDLGADRVLDRARQTPGGLNTLGWVVLGSGLLVVGKALAAR
jgi:hypothetical protein